MTKRASGEGTIEELPSGRFRVRFRLTPDDRRDSPTFETRDEAEEFRNAALAELADAGVGLVGALTLRAYGTKWLERRELAGGRNTATDRSNWTNHVLAAHFADWALANITRRDVREWVDDLARHRVMKGPKRKPISRQTRVHSLNLLRRSLEDAVDRDLIPTNPARDVRIPKGATTDAGWTYLTPEEIRAVVTCDQIPEGTRLIYAVAIFTGLREGELWGLRWADLRLEGDRPEIDVRFSHAGPTKAGKPKTIPLLAPAREALLRWKELATANPGGLVFPNREGARRQKSDDAGWADRKRPGKCILGWKREARIFRRVRFHDLRHTCASHLIMGTWGRAWSLTEVCAYLRHSSISVTQRYAHLSSDHLHATAAATWGAGPRAVHVQEAPRANPAESMARPVRLERTTFGLEERSGHEAGRGVGSTNGPAADQETARAVLTLAAAGKPVPIELLQRLASSVLTRPDVALAAAVMAGGPHVLDRATELAELVLAGVVATTRHPAIAQ